MQEPKQRPEIRSITVELVDGRKKVIQGTELADPKGGVLVWNDYGAKTVLKGFYKDCEKDDNKAKRTEALWDGKEKTEPTSGDSLKASNLPVPGNDELPAVLTKPTCAPIEWP